MRRCLRGSLLNQPCRVSATPIPAGKLTVGTASAAGNQAHHGGGALDVMVLLGLLLALLSRQILRSRFIVAAKDSRGFPTRISASLYSMHKIATDQGHKQSRSQADRKASPWFANNKIYEEK